MLWIQSPAAVNYLKPKLEYSMVEKAGGFFGIMGDQVRTSIFFEKNTFTPGEKLTVRIDCDNSSCSKPIKSFKVKLKRKISIKQNLVLGSQQFSASTYLVTSKEEGCPAKEKCVREIELTIPDGSVQD